MNRPPQDAGQDRFLLGAASQYMQDSSKVYFNLGQEIIISTDDKIRLCLIEHLSRMEKRKAWIAPLGILLTIIIVFPTTTFKEFLSLSADTWKAIFIIGGLLSAVWLIRSLWEARISSSLDDVVKSIKASGINQNAGQAVSQHATKIG
jgi:predicted Na+-dependent transporter